VTAPITLEIPNDLSAEMITEITAFAHELADAAALITLKHFRKSPATQDKSGGADFDPVTEADRAAEQIMRDMIAARYADHAIIGEEFDNVARESKYQWVLDPIDGTASYITGIPLWGTLIAFCMDGEPIIGVIDQPYLKERFTGTPSGSDLNGEAISVSNCNMLEDANLSTTSSKYFTASEAEAYGNLLSHVKMNRYDYDCYAFAMLSHGLIDVVAEAGLKVVDFVALIPVVRGAGGVITDWHGGKAGTNNRVLAASNQTLLNQAIALLTDAS